MNTLMDLLRARRDAYGERPLYTFLPEGEGEGVSLSFAGLDVRARAVAVRLRALGVGPGERVVLLFPPGLDYIAAFFGCLYAGAVAVPAYPPSWKRRDPRLVAIVSDAKPLAALASGQLLQNLERFLSTHPELRDLRWMDPLQAEAHEGEAWRDPAAGEAGLAFLQYTSGSTAEPKGVMLGHGQLLENLRIIQRAFGVAPGSQSVSWLPPYHDMGLIGGILEPLFAGSHVTLMPPAAFLQSPLRWLQAISRVRADISGGPNFAYELCIQKLRPEHAGTLDLSSWKLAYNGAEPVRGSTLQRFAEVFAPYGFERGAFHPCYGLAEATLLVSGGERGVAPRVQAFSAPAIQRHLAVPVEDSAPEAQSLVSCGRCPPEAAVVIAQPETGAALGPGEVGEVWIQGASVAWGYWEKSDVTARTFQARLRDSDRGPFLRTGDLGFLWGGELYITGRLKELIILRGRNHYPQDLELTVERASTAVRPGCGAAFSIEQGGEERLVIVQELDRHAKAAPEQVAEEIRAAVAREHELRVHAVALVRQGTVPKTSSGKIQRRLCRQWFLDGTLEVLHTSTGGEAGEGTASAREDVSGGPEPKPEAEPSSREAVVGWLRGRLASLLHVDPRTIDPARPSTSYGLDSLASFELLGDIEQRFRVTLQPATLLEGVSLDALAEQLLGAAVRARPVAVASGLEQEARASHGQRALWFMQELAPGSALYNVVHGVRLRGPLNVQALRRSIEFLAQRHPALRTTLVPRDGELFQRVHPWREEMFALRELPGAGEAELSRLLDDEAQRPFLLDQGPLFRVTLGRCSEAEHVLVLALHHAITDFWSLGLMASELHALYGRFSAGETPAAEAPKALHAEFSRQQEQRLAGPEGARLWQYWRERLRGELPILDLPTDRPRPRQPSFRGAIQSLRLGADLSGRLGELAKRHGATLYTTLLAAYGVLLSRLSGQTDVLIGTPMAGRASAAFQKVVGYFVNVVPIRVEVARDADFLALLQRVREGVLGALVHQAFPLPLMVERLQVKREVSTPPLFQSMFVFQRAHLPGMEGLTALALHQPGPVLKWGDVVVESLPRERCTTEFDLALYMGETPEGLVASVEYSTDLFEARTVTRILGQFATLLESIASAPEERLSRLSLASPDEQRLLREWNDTGTPEADAGRLHAFFERNAAAHPERIALHWGERRMSYGELNARANQLAHHLRRLGVGPEVRVGVFLQRTPELVVALLGVLKAGGAYVPLDPAYPAQRVRTILGESRAPFVLTHSSIAGDVPPSDARLLRLDALATEEERRTDPEPLGWSGSLAYVLYTSGSTGKPKGVAIQHASVIAMLQWARDTYVDGQLAGVIAATSLCFDLSAFELFAPLSQGGSVFLVDNALGLLEAPLEGAPTLLNTVPSAAAELVRAGRVPPTVRTVNLAGEVLPPALVQRLHALGSVERVYNLYGPTEDTTYSTFALMERGAVSAPIGRPMPGSQVYLLDAELERVPLGAPGEVYLAGEGLARGYLHQPSLTAERFLPDPFSARSGARMYRTGDIARFRNDGQLEYLGRIDHQVKVRGFRIELGEIEAVLRAHPRVRDTLVMARQAPTGDKQLVAYVVPGTPIPPGEGRGEGLPLADALRAHLRQHLPEYMVPAAYMVLEQLPLNANGKVDRKALPEPGWEGTKAEEAEEKTPTQAVLCELWASVLGREKVGLREDFFERGGHSLLAMQVVTRVREALGVELGVRVLFEAPRVEQFAQRVEEERGRQQAAGARPALERVKRDGPLQVSFAQQRLWFLEQLHPGQAVYNIPLALRLRGSLQVEVLRRTFAEIVRRHEALRTTFLVREGQPLQRILPAPTGWELPVEDLDPSEAALRLRLGEEARRPFNLSAGPLLRTSLLRLGPDEHVLVLNMHHIVSDGWSLGVLVRETVALYSAFAQGLPSPLPPLTVQYAEFADWHRREVEAEGLRARLDTQRAALQGAPALELPTDLPRTATRSFRGDTHFFSLPASLVSSLERVGREQGATLYMVLLAAYEALLARYSGQRDFCIGTPTAHRARAEFESLIGFFVNTLVLRANLDGEPSFADLVGRVRESALAAFAHQDVPFDKLVEAMGGERDLVRTPLFQAMFVLQNAPLQSLALPGLGGELLPCTTGTSKFDLTLSFLERDGGLDGQLEYSLDLFEPATARRMASHFRVLLEAVTRDVRRRVSELPLLTPAEREQLLVAWNDTRVEASPDMGFPARFEAQAARTPDAPAVGFEGTTLTYAQLRARAHQLAHHLRSLGVGPDVPVGLFLERSPELVIGSLGIMLAGGAYVPIDPSYPRERVRFILEDARVGALVTLARWVDELGALDAPVVCLDKDAALLERQPLTAPVSRTDADNLAYVIYTSGSTGRPKGVAVGHGSLANLVAWRGRLCGLTSEDRGAHVAGIGFDASVFELWPPLAVGASVHLPPEEVRTTPEALVRWLEARAITVVFLPTPLAELVLAGPWPEGLRVRELLTGGDLLRTRPRAEVKARLVNGYGPTEATVVTTVSVVGAEGRPGVPPPIGRPLSNVQVYVLDEKLQPVPVGTPGELYVAGASLARGYLGRPELTAERFVPNPFSREPGARMYRTGDRARWLSHGELEHLGRLDFQVKVRGFRIELGEIEAVLRAHPKVRDTLVMARQTPSGDKQLVAYVVPGTPIPPGEGRGEGLPPEETLLRTHLRQHLPEYMVPAAYVVLDHLPLNANGKVDRKALPEPEWEGRKEAAGEAKTPTQEVLCGVWASVLGRKDVGLREDFFELGGHSLLAMQVVTRVREVLGVELGVRVLFEAPRVEQFAQRVEEVRGDHQAASTRPALERVKRDGPLQVSFAQQRLWLLEQLGVTPGLYTIAVPVRLKGHLRVEVLERSLQGILQRHEALRTTFVRQDGGPVQVVAPEVSLLLEVEDLSGAEAEAEFERQWAEALRRGFDLERGPLLRVRLWKRGPDEHVMLLTMHHIAADGWSMGVFVKELVAHYEALLENRAPALPPLPVQYADHAQWQRAWLQGEALEARLGYWRRQLGGALPVLELPLDRPRPSKQTYRGAVHRVLLPPRLVEEAKAFSRREGASLFMTLLAAFQVLLHRYTRQSDILVGTPVADRTHPETERLIGFFVNTLVLRTDVSGAPGFAEVVRRVRDVTLDAYAHQDVPFELLVKELQPQRDPSLPPLFQVLFALQNTPLPRLGLPELGLEVLEADTGTAKFELSLLMQEEEAGLVARFEYNTDLFDPDTVARMGMHYETLLGNALRLPQIAVGRLKLETSQEAPAARRMVGA